MVDLFPACPARCVRQMLVGDGHFLHIEECGSRDGVPVLFLHGGPGSGCHPAQRRLFDPRRFRVVMVDQRGAGRSLPLGELEANTTDDLVTDLDTIRQALGINRWLVLGGSWGSLLALAYAQRFPATVSGLLLRGIFLGSRDEIETYARGLGECLPVPAPPWPLHALASHILGSEYEAARQAARLWLDYERRLMGESPMSEPPDAVQLAKARIQMHYLSNDCFLRVDQLLDGIDSIRHLPAVIVQGMADPVCPPHVALSLHETWPEAIWVPVDGAGHAALSPPIATACISALDWLATSLDNGWSPARTPLVANSAFRPAIP